LWLARSQKGLEGCQDLRLSFRSWSSKPAKLKEEEMLLKEKEMEEWGS
jgi:hypothetical protein